MRSNGLVLFHFIACAADYRSFHSRGRRGRKNTGAGGLEKFRNEWKRDSFSLQKTDAGKAPIIKKSEHLAARACRIASFRQPIERQNSAGQGSHRCGQDRSNNSQQWTAGAITMQTCAGVAIFDPCEIWTKFEVARKPGSVFDCHLSGSVVTHTL